MEPPAANYVFVAPNPARKFMLGGALVSAVLIVAAGTVMVLERSLVAGIVAGVAAVSLVLLWTMLQAHIPQRVTVHGSTIAIRRDGKDHRFDLEDPGVDIRVRDGEIGFAHYMDQWVVVRARDVDWKVFTDVVMHYQNKADQNAEERDRRFSS